MLTQEQAVALAAELAYKGPSPADVAANISGPAYRRLDMRHMPDGGTVAEAEVLDDETGATHRYRWYWDPDQTLVRIEQEIAGRTCVVYDRAEWIRWLME